MSNCIQAHRSWLFCNMANIITMTGFILCPFLLWVIIVHPENLSLIFSILLVVYLTDLLDGKVARRFNIVSNFGGTADRLRDKCCAASVFTLLFTNESFGFIRLFTVPIIILEILLLILLFVGLAKRVNVSSNAFGKIRFFSFSIITALLILTALVDSNYKTKIMEMLADTFKVLFAYILFFTAGSLVVHYQNFRRQLRQQ